MALSSTVINIYVKKISEHQVGTSVTVISEALESIIANANKLDDLGHREVLKKHIKYIKKIYRDMKKKP